MTEQPPTPRRIDLRALNSADVVQADRVIAAAMSRISVSRVQYPRDAVAEMVARFTRPALVAAAILAAVALGTVAVTDGRRESDSPQVAMLANWAEAQHVPTNGELLLAFQGYRR